MNWCYAFLVVIGVKLLLNTYKFLQCKYYLNRYSLWIKERNFKLYESRSIVKSLINGANVSDASIPNVTPMGYGTLASFQISVLDNFPSNREDLYRVTVQLFFDAIGVYKRRIINAVNPIYWVEFIVFLPKNIFVFLGYKGGGFIPKVFQIIYWVAGVIFALGWDVIWSYIHNILER